MVRRSMGYVLAIVGLLLGGCGFDWDSFDPRLTDSGVGGAGAQSSGAAGAGQGGAAGEAGAGGVIDPGTVWSRRFGDAEADRLHNVAAGETAHLVGMFQGTLPLGITDLVSAGGWDLFAFELDLDGSALGGVRAGLTLEEQLRSVAIASNGDIVVGGWYESGVDLDGVVMSDGVDDGVVARLTSQGDVVWAQYFGGVTEQHVHGVALVPGTEDVVVLFDFVDSMEVPPNSTLTSADDWDVAVVVLDGTDGAVLSAVSAGGVALDYAQDVAVDSSGAVLIAGEFEGTFALTGLPDLTANGVDGYVAKLNGVVGQWSLPITGAGTDQGWSVEALSDNRVVVAGTYTDDVTIGGVGVGHDADVDSFVALISSTGTTVWAVALAGPGDQRIGKIAVDADDTIIVPGGSSATFTLGSAVFDAGAFVVRLHSSGDLSWARSYPGTGSTADAAADVTGDGHVLVGGTFSGTLDFGRGAIASDGDETDVFAAKLLP